MRFNIYVKVQNFWFGGFLYAVELWEKTEP